MIEVKTGCKLADRTFCFANFEALKDCLFRLPPSTSAVRGTRTPSAPWTTSYGLDPGEPHTVTVKDTGGTTVEAWNADPAGVLSLHH
jgi:hypothetical protein